MQPTIVFEKDQCYNDQADTHGGKHMPLQTMLINKFRDANRHEFSMEPEARNKEDERCG